MSSAACAEGASGDGPASPFFPAAASESSGDFASSPFGRRGRFQSQRRGDGEGGGVGEHHCLRLNDRLLSLGRGLLVY